MAITIGDKLPAATLPATSSNSINLSALKGKKVILYFYPKDDTPGCTLEGQDFAAQYEKFLKENAIVIGVSRDSIPCHERFKSKYSFPFELLSDEEEQLCNMFDVIKLKNMYGKKVRGIERSTFLFDEKSILRKEWRKVKVDNHVAEVLQAVKEI